MSDKKNTLQIRVKRVMVAIMSVLLVLTLMTTISFNVAVISAFAEGEQHPSESHYS